MYPPAVPAPLRPIRGLGTAAVVMLIVDSVVDLIAAGISAQRATLIESFISDGESFDLADAEASDQLYAVSGVVEFLVYVATAVVFLVWLFRARANAESLSPWPHRRAKPWLIFGWGVPIVSLWFPKQIMDDIWTSSKPGVIARIGSLATAPRSGLIWAWWLTWLLSTWVSQLVSRSLTRADELPDMRDAAAFDVVANALSILAAALAIAVVLMITRLQEDRRDVMAQQPFPAMGPR
ncbi:DUF4328 domain-containing protein [Microbispora sp. NPDC049125]|uniref:DUF4328 domain-containing protein n=1 Tax=Microbispora sp. NPDC049125 TaxID=3154929 RepID=UPI0034658939